MNLNLLSSLFDSVVSMDEGNAASLCVQALDQGLLPEKILNEGLLKAMEEVGRKYENGEYFVPEILLCADALYAGLEIIRPQLEKNHHQAAGKVVLGVVLGDTHDIGKNIVKIMLHGAGFTVTDLGRNVQYEDFVRAAVETNADIIGISSLMTTAMEGMGEVINILKRQNLRERFRVIIGGAPTSQNFAKRIGADGYANSASGAANLVRALAVKKS